MGEATPMIDVQGLAKRFGSREVLRGVEPAKPLGDRGANSRIARPVRGVGF